MDTVLLYFIEYLRYIQAADHRSTPRRKLYLTLKRTEYPVLAQSNLSWPQSRLHSVICDCNQHVTAHPSSTAGKLFHSSLSPLLPLVRAGSDASEGARDWDGFSRKPFPELSQKHLPPRSPGAASPGRRRCSLGRHSTPGPPPPAGGRRGRHSQGDSCTTAKVKMAVEDGSATSPRTSGFVLQVPAPPRHGRGAL